MVLARVKQNRFVGQSFIKLISMPRDREKHQGRHKSRKKNGGRVNYHASDMRFDARSLKRPDGGLKNAEKFAHAAGDSSGAAQGKTVMR